MPMTMPMTQTASPSLSAKAVDLRLNMRKLWEDYITWTRLAIISLEGGTPDASATVARLLRNQTDIGNAIKPYYGTAAGNTLTRELKTHILIAADVIAAAGPITLGENESGPTRRLDALSLTESRVYEALPATGAIAVRELSEQSGQTMAAVRGALPILELDGLVGQDEAGWFRRG